MNFDEPLAINTFGFNVPCREFVISAQVTKERRLPMVDEFVLRLLNVVGTISPSRLSRYFGFEGRDLGVTLSDLHSRSLLTLSDDGVSLHPSAKDLFRTSSEEEPVLTTVETFHARAWFDLLSQTMVPARGRHNVRHLISLSPSKASLDVDANFARSAFDANFRAFLQSKRIRNSDDWSLYSILDVQPGRYSYAQISGQQLARCIAPEKIETVLIKDVSLPARARKLTDAMASKLTQLSYPEPSNAARNEWMRILGRDSISRASRPDGSINVPDWHRLETASNDPETTPFIGHPYVEQNRLKIADLIADSDKAVLRETSLVWIRPGGSAWGLTEDLTQLVTDLRSSVRKRTRGSVSLETILVNPASITTKNATRFGRVFDRGVQARPGSTVVALELLVIPGMLAAVSVQVPISAAVSVPIGCMTTNIALIQQVIDRARVNLVADEGTPIWERNRARSDGSESQTEEPLNN